MFPCSAVAWLLFTLTFPRITGQLSRGGGITEVSRVIQVLDGGLAGMIFRGYLT